jgi:2,5-dihydroxypyridine 5,6-dioxygenase
MKNIFMSKGAEKVVNTCVKVKKDEEVVIVTEESKLSIAEAIATEVYRVGAIPILTIMEPRKQDSEEPPAAVAAAMKSSDAFISVVGKSITHTNAVKNAVLNGSRGVVLTQFSEEMMVHGGIECDFAKAKVECKAVAEALANAEKIVLTTENGTNLTYSAKGRRGNALYCMVEKGQFSTVPTVEANVSPLENTANGVIVADASIPYIGIGVLDEPVRLVVKDGFIVSIEGGKQAAMLKNDLSAKNDPNVYNIAEMGVGLNPQCHFVGFMLEDEGVYGSSHIGIGTSITLGGTVKAACHYDLIMKNATIVVDGKTILQKGKVLI